MSHPTTFESPVAAGPPTVRLTRRRQVIGKRMRESVTTKPPVTLHTTAVAELLATEVAASRAEGAERVSFLGALARRLVGVLASHPDLNAHLLDEGLRRFEQIHLGIAVDVPQGLLVPVIHGAESLSAVDLSARISQLAGAARSGTLTPDQMLDGTFTISSLGPLGVEQFTPIINPPQIAILGVGALRDAPVWRNERWERQSVVHLSLTFDHAAVDGAPAARFLADLVEAMTMPAPPPPARALPDEETS
ncbi:MAG: 2-oxo acid dehydrogenase subunit E2 [Acidimicrobiia bacterium]